jgi:hypothetical protein
MKEGIEMSKMYTLMGADGEFYQSEEPGQLGGNKIPSMWKLYEGKV